LEPILGDITSKYQISGANYAQVNLALGLIRDEMKAAGFHDANLLDVDFLLYYILTEHPQAQVEIEQPARTDEEFDHDELIEKLVTIGTGLGFTAESEYAVAPGARVDVIWSASIANLGVVKRGLSNNTLPYVDFKRVTSEADGADLGLGDPELGGGGGQYGLLGFMEDADRDPNIGVGGEEQTIEAEGPGHH